MGRDRLLGVLAVLGAAMLWGTTGTAATFAPDVGPLAIGAAALGIGGILQAVVAVPALRRARRHLTSHSGLVWIGAVAVFIYPLAFYAAMDLAGVAIGTVISLASAPLASGVLDRFIEHRRLGGHWGAAALLGIIGSVVLVLATHDSAVHSIGSTMAGLGLGLVAGAAYATYSWAVQRLMTGGTDRAAAMGSVFGLGGTLLLPVLLLTGGPLLATVEAAAVGTYMALIPMFVGYLAFGYGLSKIPASTATTVTLIEPAVATVLAVWLVGERLSPLGWFGLSLFGAVLTLIALAPRSKRSDPHRRPQLRAS